MQNHSLHVNRPEMVDSKTQDPDANLVVVALGGYGIRVLCNTHGLGNTPIDYRFQNAVYIDFETSFLEEPRGQSFVRGGGAFIKLSSTDVRDFCTAALENRSTAPFASEIREIWTGTPNLLYNSLKAVENSTGGCGLRTISALATYAAAGQIISAIKSKIDEAKKFSTDARANTRVLLCGSYDGSCGSGGASTIAYLILRKIPGIDITVSGAFHDFNQLTVYANNVNQFDLLQANAFEALAELQRLAEESSTISNSSALKCLELLDGNSTNLSTTELELSHARALDTQYNSGVERAHERRRVNETYLGTGGTIRIIGPGIVYGIPEEILEVTKLKTELKFIENLECQSEVSDSLDSLLPKLASINPPVDRAADLLAATSHAGAMALAANVADDLSRAERDIAEKLESQKKDEKNRVIQAADTMIAASLPLNSIMGAEKSMQRALHHNQKCIDDLKQVISQLKHASAKINVGIDLETNDKKNLSLFEKVKMLPRSYLIALAVGVFAGAALIFSGELTLLITGILMISGISSAIFYIANSQDPKISETIQALQRGLRARRDLLSRNAELELYISRQSGLTEVLSNLSSLRHMLSARKKILLQELDAVIVEKSATSYPAITRSEFEDVLKTWPSPTIGKFATIKDHDFMNQIGCRAATYAEARYSDFCLDNLGAQSADEREKLIAILTAASTITAHHRADPGTISRPELWAAVKQRVFEGADCVRMALDNARGAKAVYILNWRRGLKFSEIENYEQLKEAAASLSLKKIPTRTLPDILSNIKVKNAPLKSPNHRAANINGFSITAPEYSKY